MSDLPKFAIIHHFNSPKEAITIDGYKVERVDQVWVKNYGMVRCAPYSDHFVYLDPKPVRSGEPGRWFAMCTCGSPAIIIGTKAYSEYGSPSGWLLACKYHIDFGVHQGMSKWI